MKCLESYFRIRNLAMQRYDMPDTNTKWCSGLLAVGSRELKFNLISERLILALEEGIKLGLVDFNPEEKEAFEELKRTYLSDGTPSDSTTESSHSTHNTSEANVVYAYTPKIEVETLPLDLPYTYRAIEA